MTESLKRDDHDHEQDLIAQYFTPLAAGSREALGLLDDAAFLAPGGAWRVSKDVLVEGVHFLAGSDPFDVARKALRVNVSDLAAKAAVPRFYLLGLCWPKGCDVSGLARFAAGLAADQEAFGLALIGGDTVQTPGPLTVSITILGEGDIIVPRTGAQAGDDIWVTGTIGDGFLGLKAALGEDLGLQASDRSILAQRYHLPEPRLGARDTLRAQARAAMDVSDGLLIDAGRMAKASKLSAHLELDRLPLSDAALRWTLGQDDPVSARVRLASGGDDYEILFAASPDARGLLETDQSGAAGLTRIGRFEAGEGVRLTNQGSPIVLPKSLGWSHF